jgi:hypothetical protein
MNGDEIEKLRCEFGLEPFDRLSKNEALLLEMIYKLTMRVISLETEHIKRDLRRFTQ